MKHVLSLGAGVQSSTLALMAAKGVVAPMPDAAVFADTQAEPGSVYLWLDWLKTQLPYPVIVASKGDLAKDTLKQRRSKNTGKIWTKNLIPAYLRNPDGTAGMLPRHCTLDYKVTVVRQEFRRLLGKKSIRAESGTLITCWMGISVDEAHRMKDSPVPWITNRYPLVDLGMSRNDCLRWMTKHGYPTPPRSACVFCPYHSDKEWLRLKTEEPAAFDQAVRWEKEYQETVAKDETTKGVPFLHRSLVHIDEIDFHKPTAHQPDLFGNECEGMCGV